MEKLEIGVKAKLKTLPKVVKFATGKFAKAVSLKRKLASAAKKDPEVETGLSELVGLECRVVHEEYVKIFGEPGEITKEFADHVLFKVHGCPLTQKVRKEDIEILSYLAQATARKTLNLNRGESSSLRPVRKYMRAREGRFSSKSDDEWRSHPARVVGHSARCDRSCTCLASRSNSCLPDLTRHRREESTSFGDRGES